MAPVNPVPDNFHTITPFMVVRDAKAAIEYYKAAFGAELIEIQYAPDQSSVMHSTLRIGDSLFMMVDELPMMQYWVSPQQLGGTTIGQHLFVDDVDAWFARAEKAGLETVMMPPQDTFWGDRYCQFIDRFGHAWAIATRKENLTPDEITKRAEEWFAKIKKGNGE